MAKNDVADILQAYGADPEVLEEYDCLPLRVRIVKNVVKVRTPTGARALKKVYMSDERLAYIHELTEYVAAGGLDRVPRFIHTRYGDPYVAHPSGLYYMTAWIPGREADLRKESELLAVARLLARWQQSAAAFAPESGWQPEQTSFRKRLTQGLTELNRVHDQARSSHLQSPFEKLVNACADEIESRIAVAQSELEEAALDSIELEAKQRGYMCHGSFNKHNVVFDGDSYAIVSYDTAYPGPPIYDFAMLLHRYMPAYEWDSAVVTRVFEAYESLWGRAAEDAPILSALLAAPLRSMQVLSWYERKDKEWEEDDFVDYLEASLELEEAREEARHAMLQAFSAVHVSLSHKGLDTKPAHATDSGADTDVRSAVEMRSARRRENSVEIDMISESAEVSVVNHGEPNVRTKAMRKPPRRVPKLTPQRRDVFQPKQPGLWVKRDDDSDDR